MRGLRPRAKIAIAVAVIAAVSVVIWSGLKAIACNRRNAVFTRKIESFKRESREQLKIGTKKAEVSRFFTEHGMLPSLLKSEVFGTIYTVGCAPAIACGTDRALIGVRVKVDSEGAVTDEPKVVSLYTDCL